MMRRVVAEVAEVAEVVEVEVEVAEVEEVFASQQMMSSSLLRRNLWRNLCQALRRLPTR